MSDRPKRKYVRHGNSRHPEYFRWLHMIERCRLAVASKQTTVETADSIISSWVDPWQSVTCAN